MSLAPIKLIGPRQRLALSGMTGTDLRLGPGHGPHLSCSSTRGIPTSPPTSTRLNRYAALNSVAPLVALDEGERRAARTPWTRSCDPIEPRRTRSPIDHDGRVADGYGVQDSPWLTLVSGKGKILWSYDVAVKGWPSTARLVSHVHAALAHARG